MAVIGERRCGSGADVAGNFQDLLVALLFVEVLGESKTRPGYGGERLTPPDEVSSRHRQFSHRPDPNAAARPGNTAAICARS